MRRMLVNVCRVWKAQLYSRELLNKEMNWKMEGCEVITCISIYNNSSRKQVSAETLRQHRNSFSLNDTADSR